MAKQSNAPIGWDKERIKHVLNHYENQSEDEAVAEDEAAWKNKVSSFIEIPNELVPTVLNLIARKVA
jgi:hypothetical protein